MSTAFSLPIKFAYLLNHLKVGVFKSAVFFLFFICNSCNQKDTPRPHLEETSLGVPDELNVKELLEETEKFKNKKVSVLGYLFTHEEGPWLADSYEFPLKNTIVLLVTEEFQRTSQNGNHIEWFKYDPEGKAVKIMGVYSVRHEKLPLGDETRERPVIVVESITPHTSSKR